LLKLCRKQKAITQRSLNAGERAMKTCSFLKSITLCACFSALGACQKKNESSTSQSSWFGRAPSTVVTIPATSEKIDTARISTKRELTKAVRGCLREWQKNPTTVQGFFKSKETRYTLF
jgi:hypothetical protein